MSIKPFHHCHWWQKYHHCACAIKLLYHTCPSRCSMTRQETRPEPKATQGSGTFLAMPIPQIAESPPGLGGYVRASFKIWLEGQRQKLKKGCPARATQANGVPALHQKKNWLVISDNITQQITGRCDTFLLKKADFFKIEHGRQNGDSQLPGRRRVRFLFRDRSNQNGN